MVSLSSTKVHNVGPWGPDRATGTTVPEVEGDSHRREGYGGELPDDKPDENRDETVLPDRTVVHATSTSRGESYGTKWLATVAGPEPVPYVDHEVLGTSVPYAQCITERTDTGDTLPADDDNQQP